MPRRVRVRGIAIALVVAAALGVSGWLAGPLAVVVLAIELAVVALVLWTFVPAFDPLHQDRHRLARRDAVALTFDDGPDPVVTPRVLAVLAAARARATFFVTGERAAQFPDLVRAIASAGHEIGCHGWSHRRLGWTGRRVVEDEIARSCRTLAAITGRPPRLFRAPYGTRGPWLAPALKRHAMRSIAWSVGVWDSDPVDPDTLARRVLGRVRGGDVVLLHDADGARGEGSREPTAAALPIVLDGLARRGLTTVALGPDAPMRDSRLGAWIRALGGLVVSALAIQLVFRQLSAASVIEAAGTLRWPWLGVATALVLASLVVRAFQVRPIVDPERRVGAGQMILVTFGAAALNGVLPLRWGEVARTAWLSKLTGRTLTQTARRVVGEKGIEAAALLVLAGLLAPWPGPPIAAALGCAGVAFVRLRVAWLTPVVLLGMFRWVVEIGALFSALRGTNVLVSPLDAALGIVAINLAIALPSAPANAGVLEAGLVFALGRAGIASPQALAGALVYHAIDVVPPTLLGLGAVPILSRARPGGGDLGGPPSPLADAFSRACAVATLLASGAFWPRRRRRAPSAQARVAATLGPDLGAFAAFAALAALLALAHGHLLVPFARGGSLRLPCTALASLVGASALAALGDARRGGPDAWPRFGRRVAASARDWLPVALVVAAYEHVPQLDRLMGLPPLDATLHALDVALFHVEPSVWIARFYQPLVTDLFALVYATYYFHPVIVGAALLARGERARFRELATAVVMVMCTGYFLYCALPAGPPRHALAYDVPIPSAFGWNRAVESSLDAMNVSPWRSSFPSLHCALSTVGLVFAFRFRSAGGRPWVLPALVLPQTLALCVATVYLRHHWAVDVLAGVALGLVGSAAASRIAGRWPGASAVAAPLERTNVRCDVPPDPLR